VVTPFANPAYKTGSKPPSLSTRSGIHTTTSINLFPPPSATPFDILCSECRSCNKSWHYSHLSPTTPVPFAARWSRQDPWKITRSRRSCGWSRRLRANPAHGRPPSQDMPRYSDRIRGTHFSLKPQHGDQHVKYPPPSSVIDVTNFVTITRIHSGLFIPSHRFFARVLAVDLVLLFLAARAEAGIGPSIISTSSSLSTFLFKGLCEFDVEAVALSTSTTSLPVDIVRSWIDPGPGLRRREMLDCAEAAGEVRSRLIVCPKAAAGADSSSSSPRERPPLADESSRSSVRDSLQFRSNILCECNPSSKVRKLASTRGSSATPARFWMIPSPVILAPNVSRDSEAVFLTRYLIPDRAFSSLSFSESSTGLSPRFSIHSQGRLSTGGPRTSLPSGPQCAVTRLWTVAL
jgi:hypothetical protein